MTRGRPALCPYCRSTEIISKGYRKTVTMGLRKLRLCKSCDRRFTKGEKKNPDNTPHMEAPGSDTDATIEEQVGEEIVCTTRTSETVDDLTKLAVADSDAKPEAPLAQ